MGLQEDLGDPNLESSGQSSPPVNTPALGCVSRLGLSVNQHSNVKIAFAQQQNVEDTLFGKQGFLHRWEKGDLESMPDEVVEMLIEINRLHPSTYPLIRLLPECTMALCDKCGFANGLPLFALWPFIDQILGADDGSYHSDPHGGVYQTANPYAGHIQDRVNKEVLIFSNECVHLLC